MIKHVISNLHNYCQFFFFCYCQFFFATDQTGAIVGGVFGGAVGGALLTIIGVAVVGILVYLRRKKVSCLKSILFKQHAAK